LVWLKDERRTVGGKVHPPSWFDFAHHEGFGRLRVSESLSG